MRTLIDVHNAKSAGFAWRNLRRRERHIRAPLAEVGLTKREIREFSRDLGLPTWNKPAFACLASRIPHGSEVTEEKLKQIEQAEEFLFQNGFRIFRVRHHDGLARIEVGPDEVPRAVELRDSIDGALREVGFERVTLDLRGYRLGGANS